MGDSFSKAHLASSGHASDSYKELVGIRERKLPRGSTGRQALEGERKEGMLERWASSCSCHCSIKLVGSSELRPLLQENERGVE